MTTPVSSLFTVKRAPGFIVPLLWFLSFFFSMPLVEPYEVSRLLALAVAVLALGVVLLDPAVRTARMPRMGLAGLIGVFFLWCGLTYVWSVSPFITLIAWGTLALLPLWFLIFALMPVTSAQISLVLRLAVAAGTGLALWAVAQYTLWPQFLDRNGTIIHPFADPNNMAALINMALFVALGLALSAPARLMRTLMYAACAVMLVALLLIASRAGLLLTLGGLVVFAGLARGVPLAGARARALLPLALTLTGALLVGSLLLLLLGQERVTLFNRIASLLSLQDDSGSVRMMIYASTMALIKQYPWGGAGLGTFFLMYPAVRAPGENISTGLMAHSDPLQFWAEAGLPALILFYSILVSVALRFMSFLRGAVPDAQGRLMAVALFCSLLTLAVHMHISFHLFVAAPLVMSGMVLGVWARLTASRAAPPAKALPAKALPVAPVGISVLIGMACLLVVFQTCLFSEMHTRQAVEAMERNDMATFGDKINQAGREGFGLNPRPYILAASIPLGLLQTSPRLAPNEKQALFAQTDSLLDRGLARAPHHAGAYFSKAMLYSAMGRKKEAGEFIEKTLTLDPRHPGARAWQKR